MKPYLKTLSAILIVSTLFTGCDDDEGKADVRAQATGTYNYKIVDYVLVGGTLQVITATSDEIGTFIISAGSARGTIEAKEGGVVIFKGEKIEEASNGFTFDVPDFTETDDDGETYHFEGYDGYTLNGVKYHGAYESGPKKLTVYLQTEVDGIVIILEIIGNKV